MIVENDLLSNETLVYEITIIINTRNNVIKMSIMS